MATRAITYCGNCEPCSQGCCCQDIAFTGCVSKTVLPCGPKIDCTPINEYQGANYIASINVGWSWPDCLPENPQFDFYIGVGSTCPDPTELPDFTIYPTGAVTCGDTGDLTYTREEYFGCLPGESIHDLEEEELRICVVVRDSLGEVFTQCVVCLTGADEAEPCSSSSSSSSDSSASSDSNSSSSSDSSSSGSSISGGDDSSSSSSSTQDSSSSSSDGSSSSSSDDGGGDGSSSSSDSSGSSV